MASRLPSVVATVASVRSTVIPNMTRPASFPYSSSTHNVDGEDPRRVATETKYRMHRFWLTFLDDEIEETFRIEHTNRYCGAYTSIVLAYWTMYLLIVTTAFAIVMDDKFKKREQSKTKTASLEFFYVTSPDLLKLFIAFLVILVVYWSLLRFCNKRFRDPARWQWFVFVNNCLVGCVMQGINFIVLLRESRKFGLNEACAIVVNPDAPEEVGEFFLENLTVRTYYR